MRRAPPAIRISSNGTFEVVDPSFDDLPLLSAVDPTFQVQMAPLPGFTHPRLSDTRRVGVGLALSEIKSLPSDALCRRHKQPQLASRLAKSVCDPGEASFLDLKIELATRALKACRLCARNCAVDRTKGQRGVCGLGPDAFVAEAFPHIAEEAPINPSFLISLAGCGLRCRYCQQHELLSPKELGAPALGPDLWQCIDLTGCRSLSFIGGNPDENLTAILKFLRVAPEDWALPIVWNTHAYVGTETIDLLDGVVDVYLPDYKYGSDDCGQRLSHINDYPDVVEAAIRAMLDQNAAVIVRVLVLPEHFECCHVPVLKRLARMNGPMLWLSVRGQYCPDFRITAKDGALARRATASEIAAVQVAASKLGLRFVQSGSRVPPVAAHPTIGQIFSPRSTQPLE